VLLEILIAISLIVLSLIPLVREPIHLHMAEKLRFEKMEGNRIAAWTYTEIREKFLKGEFRWEQIPSLKAKSKVFDLPPVPLLVPPVADKIVTRTFQLKTLKEKEQDGRISRLIAIHLKVGPCERTYRLIVYCRGGGIIFFLGQN
jgi:hypothetical protein